MNDLKLKLKEIKSRRDAYDKKCAKEASKYPEFQKRLKALVDEHGIECVALASNLTTKTLLQYTRVAVAPSIRRATVESAEEILKGL